ncbi:hypothetical protein VNO77_00911 [Canavalia gladiata]|uniref:Uncharacterized protein n=1 Tax=Canavalia gladiata TaxID=3824 RepID=A0AAN9R9S3_CANGL
MATAGRGYRYYFKTVIVGGGDGQFCLFHCDDDVYAKNTPMPKNELKRRGRAAFLAKMEKVVHLFKFRLKIIGHCRVQDKGRKQSLFKVPMGHIHHSKSNVKAGAIQSHGRPNKSL